MDTSLWGCKRDKFVTSKLALEKKLCGNPSCYNLICFSTANSNKQISFKVFTQSTAISLKA